MPTSFFHELPLPSFASLCSRVVDSFDFSWEGRFEIASMRFPALLTRREVASEECTNREGREHMLASRVQGVIELRFAGERCVGGIEHPRLGVAEFGEGIGAGRRVEIVEQALAAEVVGIAKEAHGPGGHR